MIVPADCCTRHGRNNPRAHAAQETRPAELALDNSGSIEQAAHRTNLLAIGETTCLKKSLDDVKRSGNTGGKGTSETTGNAVCERIVFVGGVHELREGLVGNELSGCEWYSHAESGRVGDVEGLKTFGPIDGPGTLHQTRVD